MICGLMSEEVSLRGLVQCQPTCGFLWFRNDSWSRLWPADWNSNTIHRFRSFDPFHGELQPRKCGILGDGIQDVFSWRLMPENGCSNRIQGYGECG